MSAARRLKRLQGKPQAAAHLAQALKAVEQIQGLGGLTQLGELEGLIRESHTLVERLVSDYERLSGELEVQREVFLRLLVGAKPDENLREAEARIRAEVLQERERT